MIAKKVQDDDTISYDDGTYDQVYIRGAVRNDLPLRKINRETTANSSTSNLDAITRINNPYYDEGNCGSSALDEGNFLEMFNYVIHHLITYFNSPNNFQSHLHRIPFLRRRTSSYENQ